MTATLPRASTDARRPSRTSAADRDVIIGLSARQDLTSLRIAELTGWAPETIRRIARRAGISRPERLRPEERETRMCASCRMPKSVNQFKPNGRVCRNCRDNEPVLPAPPLVDAIERVCRMEAWNDDDFCQRVGIKQRTLSFWRADARIVRLPQVEDVLDVIGRFWWDVYTPDTVRRHERLRITYTIRYKRHKDGQLWPYYEMVGRERFVDRGTDWHELQRIADAFSDDIEHFNPPTMYELRWGLEPWMPAIEEVVHEPSRPRRDDTPQPLAA